jgi:hypothetical protein
MVVDEQPAPANWAVRTYPACWTIDVSPPIPLSVRR